MERKEEIYAANPYSYSSYIEYGKRLGFFAGAEWADAHPKNPGISVKEQLPESDDLMITGCWCTDYYKYIQLGLYDKKCGEWRDDCGDVICVTHYMPIVEPK